MPTLPESLDDIQIVTSEGRHARMIRSGLAVPQFLQGVFPFVGRGVFDLSPLNDALTYRVPENKTAEVLYFRAGNISDDLIYLTLSANGKPIRYFPIGPKADIHVALAIVELHAAGDRIEICLAAPRGLNGSVVVDVGLVECGA